MGKQSSGNGTGNNRYRLITWTRDGTASWPLLFADYGWAVQAGLRHLAFGCVGYRVFLV